MRKKGPRTSRKNKDGAQKKGKRRSNSKGRKALEQKTYCFALPKKGGGHGRRHRLVAEGQGRRSRTYPISHNCVHFIPTLKKGEDVSQVGKRGISASALFANQGEPLLVTQGPGGVVKRIGDAKSAFQAAGPQIGREKEMKGTRISPLKKNRHTPESKRGVRVPSRRKKREEYSTPHCKRDRGISAHERTTPKATKAARPFSQEDRHRFMEKDWPATRFRAGQLLRHHPEKRAVEVGRRPGKQQGFSGRGVKK